MKISIPLKLFSLFAVCAIAQRNAPEMHKAKRQIKNGRCAQTNVIMKLAIRTVSSVTEATSLPEQQSANKIVSKMKTMKFQQDLFVNE